MAAAILDLSQLISTSSAQLVDVCAAQGLTIPGLNDGFTSESEAFRKVPAAAKAVNDIVAAAIQLIACVLSPQESTLQLASSHLKSSALRVAVQCHVPEMLREAGGQGLHVEDIAAKADVDSQKLARLLRTLANRHIFREVKQDVFANNRLSSSLDTGKTYDQITRDPEAKYDGVPGTIAYVELMCEDGHKGSAYVLENMKDPVTGRSGEPQHAPFPRSLGFHKSTYEWYAEPSQAYRLRRFSTSMNGFTTDKLLELYNWGSLPNDALVVDVGGGLGSLTRIVSNAYSKLKFVVQDLPSTVESGIKFWNEVEPEAIRSGQVKFQAHDFFTPQPIRNASVFVLKNILHNWSDPYALQILTHLRNAATPTTVLSVFGAVIMPSTSTELDISIETVSEGHNLNPPAILSTGYTSSSDLAWMVDGAMMIFTNSRSHTVYEIQRLLKSTGWQIIRVVLSGELIDNVQATPT